MVAFFLVLACVLDSQAGISLLGEVNRATPVDNHRGRGAAIAGFERVVQEPDRRVSHLRQIKSYLNLSEDRDPSPHQVVIRASGAPSGSPYL